MNLHILCDVIYLADHAGGHLGLLGVHAVGVWDLLGVEALDLRDLEVDLHEQFNKNFNSATIIL